jgi:hypothetical protein
MIGPLARDWKNLLACLAWSTWCFANVWMELSKSDEVYFARYAPVHFLVAPMIAHEIVLTAVGECPLSIYARKPG